MTNEAATAALSSATGAAAAPGGSAAPSLTGRRFFCSWSGGKDAYLAFQRAVQQGGIPSAIVCMLHEEAGVSRGHGLPLALLEAQAAALGVRLITRATTWDDYEATLVALLHELRDQGVEAGVFGDIDLQAHRDWVEGVCETVGFSCHLPLWQEPRRRLLDELLAGGARATIVAVDSSKLGPEYLGRELDEAVIGELAAAGLDICGENGEYHTMITAAPLFSAPIPLAWEGVEERDGHYALRYGETAGAAAPAASPAVSPAVSSTASPPSASVSSAL